MLFRKKKSQNGTNSVGKQSCFRAACQLHLMQPKRVTKHRVRVSFLYGHRDLHLTAKVAATRATKASVISVLHCQNSHQNFKSHPRLSSRSQSRSSGCLQGFLIINLLVSSVDATCASNVSHLSSRERSRVKLRIKLSQSKVKRNSCWKMTSINSRQQASSPWCQQTIWK